MTARIDGRVRAFCCYGCLIVLRATGREGASGEAQALLLQLGLGVFLAMNVMVFSLASYSEYVYPDAADGSVLFRGTLLLLSTPALVLLGLPLAASLASGGVRTLARLETLILAGVVATYGLSVAHTFRGGPVYYETAVGLLVLVTLGRYLEAQARARVATSFEGLVKPVPARRVTAGMEETVSPTELAVGDRFRVLPGETVPADGTILTGTAQVDESLLSGESRPRLRRPGDSVVAGTSSVDGSFVARAVRTGRDSTLGRLTAMLDDLRRASSPLVRTADRWAARLLPTTFVVALATFSVWSWLEGPQEALLPALSVLVVACPCALGIAAPLALWAALGRAARHGVLVRSAAVLERLATVHTVALDKTGTVTTGEPRLESTTPAPGEDGDAALALAAAVERHADHPIARTLATAAAPRPAPESEIDAARLVPGCGVAARTTDGREVLVGSPEGLAALGHSLPEWAGLEIERARARGLGVTCLVDAGRTRAVFALEEALRPESADAVAALARSGIEVALLSGDRSAAAASVAGRLGIRAVEGELTPEAKVASLSAGRASPVAFVGDGLNDAPALTAADVGIAIGCGAALTRESADVCLGGDDLSRVPWLIELARESRRTVRRNFAWAFAYNGIGLALAVTGRLTPLAAAAAMVLSSAFVVWSSLRLDPGETASGADDRELDVLNGEVEPCSP